MNGQRGYQLNFYRKINHIVYTVMLQSVSQQYFTVRVNHIETPEILTIPFPKQDIILDFIYSPIWKSFLKN